MNLPTRLNGLTFAVLGAAESGVGAAVLAARKGASVWVSDSGAMAPAYRERLEKEGIAFEENGHHPERILGADWVVKSPGIPGDAPIVQAVRRAGIPIVSEIELGFWFTKAKIIAVTGTNGKTTTASLIYTLMKFNGQDVGLAGNIGESFALQVAEADRAWFVLEVSSFQLDDILHFHPHIAILLNITPDHLDRYGGSMDAYAAAKARITEKQTPDDLFIYPHQDPAVAKALSKIQIQARQRTFSDRRAQNASAWIEQGRVVFEQGYQKSLSTFQLVGRHNQRNLMAALLALEAFLPAVADNLDRFQPVSHRMEHVGVVGGVAFINDSKATNVDAAWFALDGMDQPLIWLAGGVDKGNDYAPLKPLVAEKVNGIVILGDHREKIDAAFPDTPRVTAHAMLEAVEMAWQLAEPGDAVLLSPACASFDLFKNYEDRGNQFREAVRQLPGSMPSPPPSFPPLKNP